MSRTYRFTRIQHLPVSLAEAWEFFSSPLNLASITPREKGFTVQSEPVKKMYAGQIIEYSVKPLLGIPVYWMTEITQVSEGNYFIDEQRYGPYSLWHHQHHFRQTANGVEMKDIIHYKIPFWILGDIANALFVRRKLEKIFDYRREKVAEIWSNKITGAATKNNSIEALPV
ncbi:MAG: SRPBCC family protein [Bacteroidetes bacterium]|nr:SRPBCC family protein [Bacteroidota bacterium]